MKKEMSMKLIVKIVVTLVLGSTLAYAACPPTMPYGCVMTPSGKMRCGCGVGFGW